MPTLRQNFARHRYTPGITRQPGGNITIHTFTSVNNGTVNTTTIPVAGANRGTSKRCDDVVSSNFRHRVSNGEIINNPFTSIVSESDFGGRGPGVAYTGPWSPGATKDFSCDHLNTRDVLSYMIQPWATDTVDPWLLLPSNVEGLRREANTAALANVDTSTATALATLGELSATLDMLGNPLANIRKFLSHFKWGRGGPKLPTALQTTDAITNQYLMWYYGMKPFVSDIENIIEAYVKSGAQSARVTARGQAADEAYSESVFYTGSWPTQKDGQTWQKHRKSVKTSVVVRSGILYEPSQLSLSKSFGYRWSDLPSALWELTPWSFAIDYFSNIGKWIGALSPRIGVNYLAAWDTIRVQQTERVETTASGVWGSKFVQTSAANEWAECTNKLCIRSPKSPYASVGPTLDLGRWESKTKVMAALGLIIQQLMHIPGVKLGGK